jgi:hypothetical protein
MAPFKLPKKLIEKIGNMKDITHEKKPCEMKTSLFKWNNDLVYKSTDGAFSFYKKQENLFLNPLQMMQLYSVLELVMYEEVTVFEMGDIVGEDILVLGFIYSFKENDEVKVVTTSFKDVMTTTSPTFVETPISVFQVDAYGSSLTWSSESCELAGRVS